MSNLVRRNWSNRGGADPSTWELPVNQASKWLVPKSGSFRILGEGGSIALTNNDSRRFLLSVFIGDGGTVNIGGTSGANTIQISRSGSTITVTAQPSTGSAVTKTATTDMPAERWANVYLKCRPSGLLSNQVTVDWQTDFKTGTELLATGATFGATFQTGGKTLTCNSLSGWAWFGSTTGGFWGFGGTSTVPIDDVKYREAVLNNATWDMDVNTTLHDYTRPEGLKRAWGWAIQGGGADGKGGADGNSYDCASGSDGSPGGRGGNDGSPGSPGGSGSSGGPYQEYICETDPAGGPSNCYWVDRCKAGTGGDGGAGGAGGRGVWITMDIMQATYKIKAGLAGTQGFWAGSDGGDGGHTEVMGTSTAIALPYSNGRSEPTIRMGATTFTHNLGGANQQGGVVFYYQW